MKIKHQEIVVPNDGTDPFINCKLDRRDYANILTDIVSTYADGFVMALNNEWGAGKTTFVKMWRQSLKNEGYKTLYYNAWENDFEKDVLVALISELEELKDADKLANPEAVENAYKSVVKKAALLTKKVGPGIIRAAFKKYADTDSEDLLKIIEGTSEVALETLEAEITSYTKRKEGLKEFRGSLELLVKNVTSKKPVVFFIDELDRCRPTYSVEVLETVKHLFSVPGIVFVLSIDKEQLGHAVKGVYGSEGLNSDEYLRRFIDVEYNLPKPDSRQVSEYLYQYFGFAQFIEETNRIGSSSFRDDKINFINFAALLFHSEKINFRQAEKIFAIARVALKTFKQNNFIFPDLLIFLIFLKVLNPKVYLGILNKTYTVQELIDEIDRFLIGMASSDDGKYFGFAIVVQLAHYYHNFKVDGIYSTQQISFNREDKGIQDKIFITSKLESSDANKDLKRINANGWAHNPNRVKIDYLMNKIDLLDPVIF
ncbi:hypothetical protein FHG64_11480 [Antarcticibacterium flavum]|uniref:KAP NTPase domain-containing protein n=1 Tax=Antarcticibacterium flavum TaxID=2058175 RepID=A0A5B7X3X0_9FLAO|nr:MULTISPECIES: P-loop NTPase fold protein [Antarcticibacterium]MCM4159388.1 hypothetical protein [Antarcticibacterium sp. W02-3]QCY69970.1 hypothetical protein FHG64_11480 [Antarcticibacterium flavum]